MLLPFFLFILCFLKKMPFFCFLFTCVRLFFHFSALFFYLGHCNSAPDEFRLSIGPRRGLRGCRQAQPGLEGGSGPPVQGDEPDAAAAGQEVPLGGLSIQQVTIWVSRKMHFLKFNLFEFRPPAPPSEDGAGKRGSRSRSGDQQQQVRPKTVRRTN